MNFQSLKFQNKDKSGLIFFKNNEHIFKLVSNYLKKDFKMQLYNFI